MSDLKMFVPKLKRFVRFFDKPTISYSLGSKYFLMYFNIANYSFFHIKTSHHTLN